jgi:hypothetical protein
MAPRAIGWCVVGAVDRALYELLNLDVYDLLGLDVDEYDTAPCPAGVMKSRGKIKEWHARVDARTWPAEVVKTLVARSSLLNARVRQTSPRQDSKRRPAHENSPDVSRSGARSTDSSVVGAASGQTGRLTAAHPSRPVRDP